MSMDVEAQLRAKSAQYISSADSKMKALMATAAEHKQNREQRRLDQELQQESEQAEIIVAETLAKLSKPREGFVDGLKPFAASTSVSTSANSFESLVAYLIKHVTQEVDTIEAGKSKMPSARQHSKLPCDIMSVDADSPWHPTQICVRISCSQCFTREQENTSEKFSIVKNEMKLNKRSSVASLLEPLKSATDVSESTKEAATLVITFLASHLVENGLVADATEELVSSSKGPAVLGEDKKKGDVLASNLSSMCRLVSVSAGISSSLANSMGLTAAAKYLRRMTKIGSEGLNDEEMARWSQWVEAARKTKLDVFMEMLVDMKFVDELHKDDRRAVEEVHRALKHLAPADDSDEGEELVE